ncbi:MAG: ABC transporter permease [Opitutaceae bacterium]|nr:ABC transporter permease [Opitutaceae bacterium]
MSTLQLSLRQIQRRPGFSFMAALTLALGIGLVATQFSLIDGILLRGLPVPDAQRLVHVARLATQASSVVDWESVPSRDFLEYRQRQTVIESLAGYTTLGLNLSAPGRVPSHHFGALTTANLPDVLGVRPALGRWFTAAEDQPEQPLLIVLSHSLWQEEFGGNGSVLGQALVVNGVPGTIIGVMPPRFNFPAQHRLWVNLRAAPSDPRIRVLERVEMVGKLRAGVTLEQARAEFDTLARALIQMWPDTNRGFDRIRVQKFAFAYAGGGTQPILYLMLGMTVFILALACVNVANMLLGRAAQRTRELAVRAAVGASRGRLVRQLLGESLVLALFGAAGGILLARFGVDYLQDYLLNELNVPGWFDFRLDHRVVGIAALSTVVAGLLAGALPAWRASRIDVNTALKDDSRAAAGLGLSGPARWLVTLQIAFSTTLLIAACLLAWTVYLTRQANLRYDPERLLTGRIELHEGAHPSPEVRSRFYRTLLDRLASEPGVEAVAVTSRNFIGAGVGTQVAPEGAVFAHANDRPTVWLEVVSSGYFDLINVKPLHGRLFDHREQSPEVPVAVVNETFARRFWPGGEAVGRRFHSSQTNDRWVTVIGVVPDLQMQGLFQPPGRDEAGFYLPQDQMGWGWLDLFVRTRADPLQLITPLREAIAGIDPNQPIHSVGTLESQTVRAMRGFSMVGQMAGAFAFITLFLGAVGVYGVTSMAVSRRIREFGVRMALGATVPQVLGMVLRQGGRQIGLGIAIGFVVAFVITRPMRDVFGEQVTNSPLVYCLVAGLIGLVGFVALWFPAHRAARIDPIQALRDD